jgi:hypothetical protein
MVSLIGSGGLGHTGDFLRDGAPIDGPLVTVAHPAPLEIMKQDFEGLLAVRRYLDFERGR